MVEILNSMVRISEVTVSSGQGKAGEKQDADGRRESELHEQTVSSEKFFRRASFKSRVRREEKLRLLDEFNQTFQTALDKKQSRQGISEKERTQMAAAHALLKQAAAEKPRFWKNYRWVIVGDEEKTEEARIARMEELSEKKEKFVKYAYKFIRGMCAENRRTRKEMKRRMKGLREQLEILTHSPRRHRHRSSYETSVWIGPDDDNTHQEHIYL